MKKQAKDIKKGDKLILGGKVCLVDEVEISDLGKQGKRKVRIVVQDKEKIILVRPEDYPMDVA